MNDTDVEIQAEYRKRLAATSASERLRMMSGMFSSAKVLAFAAEGAADRSPADVFERMYRSDFSAGEVAVISGHLRASQAR